VAPAVGSEPEAMARGYVVPYPTHLRLSIPVIQGLASIPSSLPAIPIRDVQPTPYDPLCGPMRFGALAAPLHSPSLVRAEVAAAHGLRSLICFP
jgi:hypothetical protein